MEKVTDSAKAKREENEHRIREKKSSGRAGATGGGPAGARGEGSSDCGDAGATGGQEVGDFGGLVEVKGVLILFWWSCVQVRYSPNSRLLLILGCISLICWRVWTAEWMDGLLFFFSLHTMEYR